MLVKIRISNQDRITSTAIYQAWDYLKIINTDDIKKSSWQ